jgi:DNA-nicking Smr family endonuclease
VTELRGVYAKYHKEICLINRSKKLDEAQNVFAYRLFGGKIDESQVDMRIFYELMVSSGIKAEDFEEGKYGFQEKILVKPVKLKESDLSTCSTEVLDMIEGTLKKTHQPYVTFVFELSEKASFRVQDIKPHRIREFHIPTIIDEEGRRLYMCFINDQRKTLDLHGMSYDEAFEKTKAYLQEKFDNYEDICTVITGRGNHENNNGSRGVISSAFPGWMKSKEFKPLVKHFVQRDGVYSVYLNNPEICDLKKLDTGQDPCEFVCETIRKVLLTNDLRLQILFDDPGFSMKLYEHLIFKAGNLAMQMSPYSQLTLPGELRLNLRNGNGPGSIHNFGGYEEKSRKTQKEKSNLKPSHKKSDPGKIKGAESPKKKTSEQRRNTPTKKPPVKQLNKAVPPKTTDPTIVTHPKPAPTTQAKAPMQTKNLDGKKQKSGAKSRPEYQKKK